MCDKIAALQLYILIYVFDCLQCYYLQFRIVRLGRQEEREGRRCVDG